MYNIFKFPSVVAFEDVKAKGGSVFALPKSACACSQARTGPSRVRAKHPSPCATAEPLGVIGYDGMSTFARCPPAAPRRLCCGLDVIGPTLHTAFRPPCDGAR